mmetsp:Transcript_99946/g.145989  ORF Transcript_99946/g.145989 Transcript_99946/m.145989 type:complete len:97 (-) Transcript_99946:17-307(-)|eukprot:CAMPEP_0179413298 /NCGR_PEP_ID=MMETSP0799-20121207/5017_1 /TAXON_ID=46947 /ORGANISM="Geminigera cryophila, Strain CCMP2564" /LENGTH=96 /DNA_ID=CAMNT_0021185747 /DNA_START=32 /DNA_END=322 /DNA_ORIENTATION=-
MPHGHSDKNLPRADLSDNELKELCVTAVRQHRDECRLWASLRVGLVNHLGHEICQELEIWTATFYATRNAIPMDSDVEKFAVQILEKRAKIAPRSF